MLNPRLALVHFSAMLKSSDKHHGSLNCPVGSKASNGISGQPQYPAGPINLQGPEGPDKSQFSKHEEQLAKLYPDIEAEQRPGQFGLRHSRGRQATGKAKTVQEPETKSDEPRVTYGETGLPTFNPDYLRAQEQNRQGDSRIQRRQRSLGIAEGGNPEGDRMGDSK